MDEQIPVYVIGLEKDDPIKESIASKFQETLEKQRRGLSSIVEAKISIKSQNIEGKNQHYDVTSNVTTSGNNLVYTESGWNIMKICEKLCNKIEREALKNSTGTTKRQRESIRKNQENFT